MCGIVRYVCRIELLCVLFRHIQLQAFEQGYKYRCFVLVSSVPYACVFYMFMFALFGTIEHV